MFAFSTILSLNFNKFSEGRKQPCFLDGIIDYVLLKSEQNMKKLQRPEFKRIIETKNIGLLMAERMINLPANIVPSMHTELP